MFGANEPGFSRREFRLRKIGHGDDDVTALLAGLDAGWGGGDLRQGEGAVDHRSVVPAGGEIHQPCHIGGACRGETTELQPAFRSEAKAGQHAGQVGGDGEVEPAGPERVVSFAEGVRPTVFMMTS